MGENDETIKAKKARVFDQMIDECLAMFHYALASGKSVPKDIGTSLENLGNDLGSGVAKDTHDTENKGNTSGGADTSTGKALSSISELIAIYNRLVDVVKPARPSCIVLFDSEKSAKGRSFAFGAVPILREFIVLSILSLLGLLCASLFYDVNAANLQKGLFDNYGTSLLKNMAFILFAASLGASFSALYKLNGYVSSYTYEPQFNASYWSRYVLGLVAGIIVSELIPSSWFEGVESAEKLTKPVAAILGGFSATAIYRMLNAAVKMIENVFRNQAKTTDQVYKSMADQRIKEAQMTARIQLAQKLSTLQKSVDKGNVTIPQNVLNGMIDDLMK